MYDALETSPPSNCSMSRGNTGNASPIPSMSMYTTDSTTTKRVLDCIVLLGGGRGAPSLHETPDLFCQVLALSLSRAEAPRVRRLGASAHRDVRRRAPGMVSWRPPSGA